MKYGILVVNHEQLFISCDSLQTCRDMLDVRARINFAGVEGVAKLLEPYVKSGNPEAEFLLASIGDASETDEEFDRRHLVLLKSSATKGYPAAVYALGACYDTGELVDLDKELAATYFAQAAKAGHARSQWIHGEDLLYGRNGVVPDEAAGVAFMKRSADSKFVPALRTLSQFYRDGQFGLQKDLLEADRLLLMIDDDDAID